MKAVVKIGAILAVLTLGVCSAQTPATVNKEAPKFFHLTFVVKEVDEGRVINERSYSTILTTDQRGGRPSVRTGSKVPLPKGAGESSYIDLGISFDCRYVAEMGSSLMLDVTAEISSIATGAPENSSGQIGPVIRQNRWNSEAIIPVGRPTTIYSSDDLTSKRKMQIELTATPIAP